MYVRGAESMMRRVLIQEPVGKRVVRVSDVDPIEVLHRLKRRFGRERAQLDRWSNGDEGGGQQFRDRSYYEANQWSAAMGMIDDEIKKVRGNK